VAHVGHNPAAAICGLPPSTFGRRLSSMDRASARTITGLGQSLQPHRDVLASLADIDFELSNLEAEIASLRETLAADPHTPYVDWLDRTHIRTTEQRGSADGLCL
jgi:hypothetical protein